MSQYKKGNVLVVIIVVIAIAIVGLLGYIVWQNFFNKPATTAKETATSTEQVEPEPATKTYDGSDYTTKYFDTWKVKDQTNPDGPTTTFTSPDYTPAMEVGAETGATVTISRTASTGDLLVYVKEFLTQVNKPEDGYFQLEVAGQVAYSYFYTSEGATFYHTIFNYKGNNYLFVYQPAFQKAATYQSAFDSILSNFTLK